MTFTVTLNDILIFLASIAGIVLLVYLALTAIKLNRILTDVKYIVDKNKDNIDSIMVSLPRITTNVQGITTNVQDITGELNDGVKAIGKTAETIEKSLLRTSRKVKNKTENIVDYIQLVGEITRKVTRLFKK